MFFMLRILVDSVNENTKHIKIFQQQKNILSNQYIFKNQSTPIAK